MKYLTDKFCKKQMASSTSKEVEPNIEFVSSDEEPIVKSDEESSDDLPDVESES